MKLNDGGLDKLQVLDNFSGVMNNSADFFTGEYNSHLFNSLFGFPYSYYQMYIPNISFGNMDCSN